MSDEALPLPVEVPGGDASLAILLRIADAVDRVAKATEDAGRKGEESATRQKSAWETIAGAIESTTDRAKVLAERYVYITQALDDVAERAEAIGRLAEEQERLDLVSSRLGVSMDEAADAAGRFADEVEPMNASGRLLQEGVRASQTELNALMRVAGSASLMLGVTTAQATEQLTDALVSGRERGLMQFGTELGAVAGSTHSLEERLAALVSQANHTERATDTSADAVRRLRDKVDDYKRTVATAFMEETIRIASFGTTARSTAGDVEDLGRKLTALGDTAATVLNVVARPIAVLGGVFAYAANAVGSTLGAAYQGLAHGRGAAQEALNDAEARSNDITSFMQNQIDVLNGIRHDGEGGTRSEGGTRVDPARVLRAGAAGPGATESEESALRTRRADATARGRRESPAGGASGTSAPPELHDLNAESIKSKQNEQRSNATHDSHDADAERRRQIEEENRAIEQSMRGAHADAESLRSQSPNAPRGGFMERVLGPEDTQTTRWQAYADAQRRAQEAAERQRFAASDQGRAEQAAKDHDTAMERRRQDERIASMRSFTSEWEDLHGRQVNATHEAAGMLNTAFSAIGEATTKHFQAVREGREAIGEALQGILSDTLSAIGKEAAVKGGMQLAEGLANLIIAPALSAQNFAAMGAYFSVAALAGATGSALAPSAATHGTGDRNGRTASLPAANDNAVRGGNVYTFNQYAPTFGGRNGSRAEAGEQIGRYTTASEERTRRAA